MDFNKAQLLDYENLSKNGHRIYNHIFELLNENPFLKSDTQTTIYFINRCSGFGSQLTLFIQNAIFVNLQVNPNIVCLPCFCQNNRSFKYHEETFNNSFFLYFKHLKHVSKNNKVFFVMINQLMEYPFFEFIVPLYKSPINKIYCEYFRDKFSLKIGKDVIKYFENIKKQNPAKKIIGIHIRSIAQKLAHNNEYLVKGIPERLKELKDKLDSQHGNSDKYKVFIATDVNLYINYSKQIFGDIEYLENIIRIDSEEDSIPLLDKYRGFKLGEDILNDCLGLSLCDEAYLSNSNIIFIIDFINKYNDKLIVKEY